MYVYSNYLYYQLDTPLLSDDDYDSLVRYLARTYENLPEWFTSRISQDELKTGAYALSLTDQEKEQALQWVERVTQYKTRNS
jgi:NAD-dependent DNA ligase